jgi:hypothetical protein
VTRFLGTPLKGEGFSSSSDEAFSAKVAADTQPRIRIDAGGRITWGGGSAAGDVYVYRYGADIIKFVGNVAVDALFVDGIEVDTTGATLDQVLKYNGTKFAPGTNVATVASIDAIGDVVITSPLQFQGLMYDGTNWVNSNIPNVYLVRNNTGSTILKGTLVGAVDAEPSGRIDVAPFQVTGTENSELRAMGIATSNISSGVNGEVMNFGTLTGLDTRGSTASALAVGDETWAAGDILFAHPTVDGKLTNVRPQHDLAVAFITVRHASTGQIAIRIIPGNNHLEWMHDVSLVDKTSGDFLKYNGTLWVNDAIDLGTDTTGNYMSGISGTSPVSVAHTAGEGSSATVSLAASYGDTQNPYASKTANYVLAAPDGTSGVPTFRAIVAADIPTLNQNTTGTAATVTGAAQTAITSVGTLSSLAVTGGVTAASLTLSGNLIVNGSTTTVNSTVTTIDDPVITLGGDTAPSSDDNKDRGIEFRYHNGAAAKIGFFGYDDSTGRFVMIPDATNTSEVFAGTVGDIQAGTFFGDLSGTATNITASSNTSLTSLSNLTTVGTLGSLIVSGATAGDLVRITQTGAGNAFVVEDSTNPDSTPFVISANGNVGIGTTSLTISNLAIARPITGGTTAYGVVSTGAIQSDVTTQANGFISSINTTTAAFTLSNLNHFAVSGVTTPGAGSTITNQYGYLVTSQLTGGTNNYAFASNVAAATGRWNLYMGGTAQNYMAGGLGIGTPTPASMLHVAGGALGGTAGNELIVSQIRSTNANQDIVYTKYRRVSTGADWTTAQAKIQRTIDATDMGYIAFGGTSALDVRIGSGTTDMAVFASTGVDIVGNVSLTGSVIFEGATANNFETTVSVTDPTADRTITFPDATGTVAVSGQNVSFNDVTVAGNLNVTGSTFGSATLDVDNFKITLNASVAGAPTLNGEIEVNRGTSTDVRIRWNEVSDLWEYTNDGTNYSRIGSALMTVSDTPPSSPYTGDLWFESDSGITFVRYDSHWIEIGASGIGAVTSDTAPSSPANGQIWFESDTNQLKIYYSGTWIQVGGSDAVNVINAINAKGDLVVGTANDTVTRLGAGANGSVLSANSSTASGLEWVSRAAIVDDFAVASIMGAY